MCLHKNIWVCGKENKLDISEFNFWYTAKLEREMGKALLWVKSGIRILLI
jgi:hypothetical protein